MLTNYIYWNFCLAKTEKKQKLRNSINYEDVLNYKYMYLNNMNVKSTKQAKAIVKEIPWLIVKYAKKKNCWVFLAAAKN